MLSTRGRSANVKKKGTDNPSQALQDNLKAELKEALLEKKAAKGCLAEAAEGP